MPLPTGDRGVWSAPAGHGNKGVHANLNSEYGIGRNLSMHEYEMRQAQPTV